MIYTFCYCSTWSYQRQQLSVSQVIGDPSWEAVESASLSPWNWTGGLESQETVHLQRKASEPLTVPILVGEYALYLGGGPGQWMGAAQVKRVQSPAPQKGRMLDVGCQLIELYRMTSSAHAQSLPVPTQVWLYIPATPEAWSFAYGDTLQPTKLMLQGSGPAKTQTLSYTLSPCTPFFMRHNIFLAWI